MAQSNNLLFVEIMLNKQVSNKKFVVKKRKGKTFFSKIHRRYTLQKIPLSSPTEIHISVHRRKPCIGKLQIT